MPDDDNILVARGNGRDPGNEVHLEAENVSVRTEETNLLLMLYRIEPGTHVRFA